MLGGLVVYSNEAKTALAGVPAALIEAHGAVSPEVATALAAGARSRLGADIGIGITGIAGPGGGTPDEAGRHRLPLASRRADDAEERTVRLPGGRADVRDRTTTVALHMLRALLLRARRAATRRRSRPLRRARPPGARARDALAAVGAAADPERLAAGRAEALHVTLAFLGSRPPADVAAIAADRRRRRRPAPRARARRVLLLPPRRARVLTVALDDPDGTLAALQARVSGALAAAGVYTPEKRPFRPHVTVARLRPRARRRAPRLALEPLAFDGARGHALRLAPASLRRPLRAARAAR